MRNLLRIYSDILILKDETYRLIKRSRAAVPFAILLFLTMSLLAGCGQWLALPGLVNRPILSEQIGIISDTIDTISQRILPTVDESLEAISQDNLSFALREILPPDTTVTAEALAEVMQEAGLSSQQLLVIVNREAPVDPAVIQELRDQPPSGVVIETIVAETGIEPAELKEILTRSLVESGSGTGLGSIPITAEWLEDLLVQAALAPETIRAITIRLGLPPEEVAYWSDQVNELPEQADGILAVARRTVEALEPPLGVRVSQTIRLFGSWLASPFVLLAGWLPLVLLALLVAKSLGGKGTITEHLVASALAMAPAFLLFFSFASELTNSFPVTVAAALTLLGRLFALIAFAWAAAILVKSLSVAHGFSLWRAVATIVLTYAIMVVVLPLMGVIVSSQLLGA